MNIAQCHELLSPENLRVTSRVLQAIDELAEQEFLEKHQKHVVGELGHASESQISEMADKSIQEFPSIMLTCNSFGYNMLTTHAYNALIAIRLPEKAQILVDARL